MLKCIGLNNRPWWQCHFSGTVIMAEPIDTDRTAVTLECECYPVYGDKFTTLHGQKGVITILDDKDMPRIRKRHAELVKILHQ